ncbi:hypothetical protein HPB48_015720 [Haemaphysalis longicornis]|uniref:Egal-1 winged helix domain-containing protein n=1 Tax=Haemaphysalis longicornis TaxID=44386 RepID=A0A9J6GMP6_HAELO|nr:hypothetical protein HPB48_015720 [Haemaphysalis longicornis]
MSERSSHSTYATVKFLKERVESHQGISLQQLTGHLSLLPPELRTTDGCSVKSLMVFLQKFPEVFDEDNLYVARENRQGTSPVNVSAESVASASDGAASEKDVTCLTGVTGTVYRLFTLYGFISIESPIRTSVYFDVQSLENAQQTSLRSSGLQVGDSVVIDARTGPKDCKAKFRATRVTRATPTRLSSSPVVSPHSANDGGMGDCNTLFHLVNQHGVVEFAKSSYGFIKFGPNERERALFHANNVDKSLRSSIKNLPGMFSVFDKVRFNAKLSMKPSEKVKWEATTVYLCRSTDRSSPVDLGDFNVNEVFMPDDDSDPVDLLRVTLGDLLRATPSGMPVWLR